jgi:hypothetical protein
MKIEYIKNFSKELSKLAFPWKAALSVGTGGVFGGMSISGAHQAAQQSMLRIGRGAAPIPLQPSQNILRRDPLARGIGRNADINTGINL